VTAGTLVTKQAFDEVVTAREAAVSALGVAEQALAAFKSEQAEQAATAAVDAAITAGKFTPAVRESLLKQARADLATFTAVAAGQSTHPAAQNAVATRVVESGSGLPTSTLEMLSKLRIDPKFASSN